MNPAEYDALFRTEDAHWWFRGLWRDVAWALKRFAPRRQEELRWLDAGSGTGGLLASLSSRGGFRLAAGLELSSDGLTLARRRKLPALVRGSVERLPVRDASLDAITSIDVLCHRSVEDDATLAEAARCLAPGGILILHVPAYQWLMSAHDRAVSNDRRFVRSEVERLVVGAGLTPLLATYRNSLLFPLIAVRRLATLGRTGPERSDVGPARPLLGAVGSAALCVESGLRRVGFRAPFGLSVFCVAAR
ncbi:MAG TPA: class I SAM-dependent methyltransferase [Thermoanaerobaculia bacterium]|nr:class I SAM-dependent methyltransferase [Thermoanaerobaculia bacterium]